ncbi:hypothetical protein [Branchiibius cervicis]|uniref:Uncharacterized protein n=1 Tax=Branchiibius cervicis TaxID=908252 RepID=A0ABW2AWF8_9MICO
MTRQYEIRLIGHQAPDGEVLSSDAVNLISSFKELTYRLTRSAANREGLGRTDAVLEKLATVRVSLRAGSTRLGFVVGDEDGLIDPVADEADAAYWRIVQGLASNSRPEGVSESAAVAVDDLIQAMAKASPTVELNAPDRPSVTIATAEIIRAPWQRREEPATEQVTLHGILEMVDLASDRFRIRDAVGNKIDLVDVVDSDVVAHLVGVEVAATGGLVMGSGSHRTRLMSPTVVAATPVFKLLGVPATKTVEELVAEASQAPPAEPLDLTDDELAAFLAAARG